jgi:hypothetical protein
MEWITEGLGLLFVGINPVLATAARGVGNPVSQVVIAVSAAMLLMLARVSALTRSRTSIVPMRICPFIKTVAALLFITGTVVQDV